MGYWSHDPSKILCPQLHILIFHCKREWQDGRVTELCVWDCWFESPCLLLFVTLGKTLVTPCKTATGWRLRPVHLVSSYWGKVIMWWKDNKLYDIQLVMTLGLTKTEVWLCPERNDSRSQFWFGFGLVIFRIPYTYYYSYNNDIYNSSPEWRTCLWLGHHPSLWAGLDFSLYFPCMLGVCILLPYFVVFLFFCMFWHISYVSSTIHILYVILISLIDILQLWNLTDWDKCFAHD